MPETINDLIRDRFGLETDAGRDMPADGELARALAHRTHRRYTDAPVADDLLEVLLACALSASSKSDLQQLSILLVRSRASRDAIQALIPSMPWIGAAPVFMIFCGDVHRIRRVAELRGKPFANDTLDNVINATIDAALAMEGFTRAAEAAGLGCCPISHVRDFVGEIARILELPGGVFPISGLCVGWPSQDGFISMRLPPAVTVHTDAYHETDLAGQIDEYDRRRDQRFSVPPEKHKLAERYGHPDLYGWSEDKARQMSERMTSTMREFLTATGVGLE